MIVVTLKTETVILLQGGNMSIPNTVVKFVNRENEIEDFDISRIVDSIARAIEDLSLIHI